MHATDETNHTLYHTQMNSLASRTWEMLARAPILERWKTIVRGVTLRAEN